MRWRPLVPLLGLRHDLFWAKARSRNAKIAMASGLLLTGWLALMLAMGGGGIGIVAARFGHPILIADFAFGMVFVCALAGALAFGLDSPSALSDEALRRYPLSRLERLAARYAAGLFDPLWLFVLVLDLGVAAGFVAVGLSAWWLAVPATILFFLTNYLAARLLVEVVGRITAMRGGPIVLVLAFVSLFALPAMLMPAVLMPNRFHHPGFLAALRFSPPVAAASLVARGPALESVGSALLMIAWFLGFGAALVALEGVPIRSGAVAGAEATWGSLYDRVAAVFGPALAPLVGKTLRYYARSPMFWFTYLFLAIGVPLISITDAGKLRNPAIGFFEMLGWILIAGGYGSQGMVGQNVFGFDRSGFRRYFFLPASPAAIVKAVAFVPLLLGTILVAISVGVWAAFWRAHLDTSMVIMLLSAGFGGMFLFQALGLWTSLLSPRAMKLKYQFGRRLPLAQQAVMAVAIVAVIGLPVALRSVGYQTVLAYWWLAPAILILTVGFYFVTLREGARMLRVRRERMLPILERNP